MRCCTVLVVASVLLGPPCYAADEAVRSPLLEQGRQMVSAIIQAEKPSSLRSVQQRRVSTGKAALVGALIGGAGGATVGALYCQADCGGGPKRGALVFAPIGAGIGAGAGVLIAWLANRAP